MKVERNGKKGPITIILNGNGEPEYIWHLFNVAKGDFKNYLERNVVEGRKSAKVALDLLIKAKDYEYWQAFNEVFDARSVDH